MRACVCCLCQSRLEMGVVALKERGDKEARKGDEGRPVVVGRSGGF